MTYIVLKILPDALYKETGRTVTKHRAEDMALDVVQQTGFDAMIVEIDGVYSPDDNHENAHRFYSEKKLR